MQHKPTSDKDTALIPIGENRRARHNYAIEDTFECGLVLVGTEVKSLRARHVNFGDAYAFIKNGEVFLIGLKIEPFSHGTHENHYADRTRKLLMHKKEIQKLARLTSVKGYTLVPLKLYFKNGRAKVLIGVGKGKGDVDKREDIKRREADRAVARVMRRG